MNLSVARFRLAVAAMMTVSFLGALDHTIVATSLSTIAGDLRALEQISWILVSYTVASTVVIPVLGKLGDTVGARAIFLGSLVTFVLASFACGASTSIGMLIVARVLQGAASAGLSLMSQTIIAELTTPRQRPQYLSLIGATFPAAILIGPLGGGLITDAWGWQWVFWINVPVGLIAVVVSFIAIPRLPGTRSGRFDIAGTLSITVFIVAAVLASTWGASMDSALTMPTIVAAVASLLALGVFWLAERRAAAPLVPLRHFGNRDFTLAVALSLIIGAGLFAVVGYVPTYVQMVFKTSAAVSGLVPIAMVFGMLISTLATGWLAGRTGRYRAYPIAGTALVGIGTGMFMNIIVAVAQSAVPRNDLGAATATPTLVRQIGSSVGTAVAGSLLAAGVALALPSSIDSASLAPHLVRTASTQVQAQVAAAFAGAMFPVFLALATLNVVGFICSCLFSSLRLSDHMNESEESAAPSVMSLRPRIEDRA